MKSVPVNNVLKISYDELHTLALTIIIMTQFVARVYHKVVHACMLEQYNVPYTFTVSYCLSLLEFCSCACIKQ